MTDPADRESDPRVVTCTYCGCVVDDIRVGHCDWQNRPWQAGTRDQNRLVDPPWNPDSTDLADFGGRPGSVAWYDAQERDYQDGVE